MNAWFQGFSIVQVIKHIYTDLMSYEAPVVSPYLHSFEFLAIYLSVAFHKYPKRGNNNQSKVMQVN